MSGMKLFFISMGLLSIVIFFVMGCTFAEINIVHRQITDVGDGTLDTYSDAQKRDKKEETNMKLLVPLK